MRRVPLFLGVIVSMVLAVVTVRAQTGGDGSSGALVGQVPVIYADVATVDAIVSAAYRYISCPAGSKNDWDRLRVLFIPGARLIPTGPISTRLDVPGAAAAGSTQATVLTIDELIAAGRADVETKGFFESDIARSVERYGHIAHVLSTYESRRKPTDPKPFARGINSFQLVNDGKRWWIVTIFWEEERPENPIPKRYLPPQSRAR